MFRISSRMNPSTHGKSVFNIHIVYMVEKKPGSEAAGPEPEKNAAQRPQQDRELFQGLVPSIL